MFPYTCNLLIYLKDIYKLFISQIPASRQHPWQQDQRSPQVTRAPLTYQHSSPGGHSDQSHNASPRVTNNPSQAGQRSGRRRVQYSDQQM